MHDRERKTTSSEKLAQRKDDEDKMRFNIQEWHNTGVTFHKNMANLVKELEQFKKGLPPGERQKLEHYIQPYRKFANNPFPEPVIQQDGKIDISRSLNNIFTTLLSKKQEANWAAYRTIANESKDLQEFLATLSKSDNKQIKNAFSSVWENTLAVNEQVIQPVQRPPRYQLLLQTMAKSPIVQEKKDFEAKSKKVTQKVAEINSYMTRVEKAVEKQEKNTKKTKGKKAEIARSINTQAESWKRESSSNEQLNKILNGPSNAMKVFLEDFNLKKKKNKKFQERVIKDLLPKFNAEKLTLAEYDVNSPEGRKKLLSNLDNAIKTIKKAPVHRSAKKQKKELVNTLKHHQAVLKKYDEKMKIDEKQYTHLSSQVHVNPTAIKDRRSDLAQNKSPATPSAAQSVTSKPAMPISEVVLRKTPPPQPATKPSVTAAWNKNENYGIKIRAEGTKPSAQTVAAPPRPQPRTVQTAAGVRRTGAPTAPVKPASAASKTVDQPVKSNAQITSPPLPPRTSKTVQDTPSPLPPRSTVSAPAVRKTPPPTPPTTSRPPLGGNKTTCFLESHEKTVTAHKVDNRNISTNENQQPKGTLNKPKM